MYVCESCGTTYSKWQGKCDTCQSWNSINLNSAPVGLSSHGKNKKKNVNPSSPLEFASLKGTPNKVSRISTTLNEFDRVLGGGLVPGSVTLVGGDPGIGKSTLLLQALARISHKTSSIYISGEEGVDQIKMRAQRLGLSELPMKLASINNLQDVIQALDTLDGELVIVIDSIQTMYLPSIENSSPGSITQVRSCAQELINLAKNKGFSIILVSHVTKEGVIAGPRTLEHMVDVVVYFEGEKGSNFRVLRTVKNRFGATDEIGIFEIGNEGLREVSNPSEMFLSERQKNIPGTVIYAGIEGSRPILVEIQALVSNSNSQYGPRRVVVGWDQGRVAMLLAILEARGGIKLGYKDVFINVVGGLKIYDTGCDLAIAAAIISATAMKPISSDIVIFGEVGLVGEIRAVSQMTARLKEASRLGFTGAYTPPSAEGVDNLKKITKIQDLVALILGG